MLNTIFSSVFTETTAAFPFGTKVNAPKALLSRLF